MAERSSSDDISTRLQRITELAERLPDAPLTTLAHHIDEDWLREAYRRTRKDGATGVDGQTGAAYGAELEANLKSLLDRAKSGSYRAPRAWMQTETRNFESDVKQVSGSAVTSYGDGAEPAGYADRTRSIPTCRRQVRRRLDHAPSTATRADYAADAAR